MTKIENSEKTEIELMVYGKEFKDLLLSEIYKLSTELDWTMFPKSMSRDFTNKSTLVWCLSSKEFLNANKTELCLNFRGKILRLLDFSKSDGYQKNTYNREVSELKRLHKSGVDKMLEKKVYTEEEIKRARRRLEEDFPWEQESLKEFIEALQKIHEKYPNATILRDYGCYPTLKLGREPIEETKARLEKSAQDTFENTKKLREKFLILRAKYPEVVL